MQRQTYSLTKSDLLIFRKEVGSREMECQSRHQYVEKKGLCTVRFQLKVSEGSLGKAEINSGLVVVSDAGLEVEVN